MSVNKIYSIDNSNGLSEPLLEELIKSNTISLKSHISDSTRHDVWENMSEEPICFYLHGYKETKLYPSEKLIVTRK